jgi:hypothetical protein
MGKASRNEEKKLTAGWFNTVSAACITVGMVGPAVARAVGALGAPLRPTLTIALSVGCILISSVLHWQARRFLKDLED